MQQQSLATARGADGVHRTDAAPPQVSSPIPGKAFTAALIRPALVAAVRKLSPRQQLRNPVMFVVYVGSLLTTLLCVRAAWAPAGGESWGFVLAVTVWLWFTVLFANFAEALAEGRSRQQAQALRGLKTTVMAKVLLPGRPAHARATEPRAAARLRGLERERVLALVQDHTEPPPLAVLGEPVVNVLRLNLALDALQ